MVETIARRLSEAKRIAVTFHARPDGDAVGSGLGLALALRQIDKQVDIVSVDPVPTPYRNLPAVETIQTGDHLSGDYDAVVILECNNFERTGIRGLDEYFAINIDHHPQNDLFGDLNWIDPSAAAVAELVYELIGALGIELSAESAANLYAAVMTDTGSFRFSGTTQRTFEIAARLVEAGADPALLAEQVYMTQPASRVRLLAKVLNTLRFNATGQVAWLLLTLDMRQQTDSADADTEGIVNYALGIEGVQACAFFREQPNTEFRVSLRSKGAHDVGEVARYFGGGGHPNAAGLTVFGTLDEVQEKVVTALEKMLAS